TSVYGGMRGMRWTYNATFVLRRALPGSETRTFTHPSVFEGIRNGADWADPECDPTRIDWADRQARAAIPFEVINGRPVNPCERTRIRYGRGELGHWGEQLCADAIALATDPRGRRWLAMIERADGNGWALPGGYVDPGEDPTRAAIRELAEETGLHLEDETWQALPARYVPDPRASDESWMVTVPSITVLAVRGPEDLPRLVGGDDAKRAAWLRAENLAQLTADVEIRGGQIFTAHRELLTATLNDH
ncbi:NUDIX domain-containing protein, partial [Planobispora rosea]